MALDFQDDESSEDKAITAYNSLMDKGMQAMIGTVTSAPCIAVKELTKQDNILQITPSGSAIECITDAPNVFRLCFTDPLQGTTMADFVKENEYIGYFVKEEVETFDLVPLILDIEMPKNYIGMIYSKNTINLITKKFIELVLENR